MDDDDLRDMHYGGESLDRFATYEDYLDSQISETDMYYLEVGQNWTLYRSLDEIE